MIVLLAVIGVLIAFPFLVPALAVSAFTAATGLLEVYLIAIVPLTLFIASVAPFVSGAVAFGGPRFNLKKENIQLSTGFYKLPIWVNPRTNYYFVKSPGLILSKGIKNNPQGTSVTSNTNTNPSPSIGENILRSSLIQADVFSMLKNMIARLETQKNNLEHLQKGLNQQQNPYNNSKKTSMLSSKLAIVEQQIAECDRTMDAAKAALPDATFRRDVEAKYRYPLLRLVTFLDNHKKHAKGIERKNIQIKKNIEQLKKDRKQHPNLDQAIYEQIQKLETLKNENLNLGNLTFILSSILPLKVEMYAMQSGRSQSDIDFVNYAVKKMESDLQTLSESVSKIDPVLYLGYFEESATTHYSRLLKNPTSRQKTLDLLNQLLIDYPLPDEAVNQTINYILANHFYTQSETEQACIAALKLNSSKKSNADLKERIIESVVYPDGTEQDLPCQIEDLLLTSHCNPQAYDEIKKFIPSWPNVKTPVQFSSAEPRPAGTQASPTSSSPKLPFK